MRMLLATSLLAAGSLAGSTRADEPDYKRTEDVIYGRKFGTALTMDVFQPPKPNGARGDFLRQRRLVLGA